MAEEKVVQQELFGQGQTRHPKRNRRRQTEEEKALMRERYRARIAQGLCGFCGETAEPGKKRCSRCREKQNACQNHRRQGPLRGQRLAQAKAVRDSRVANGRCVTCDDPARPGCVLCETCLARDRSRSKAKRAINRASRRCDCGGLAKPGRNQCAECLTGRQYACKQRKAARRAQGLCQYCGKGPPLPERVGCQTCLFRITDWARERRRKRQGQGLCWVCGKAPAGETSPACQGCFFKLQSHYTFGNRKHADELREVWDRQEGKCAYSGRRLNPGADAELDHIVPVSAGGTNDIGNLQWVHTMANQMKFNYGETEFFAMIEEIYRHRIVNSRG